MKPLIDADILRYEIGFAAQVGWRAITEDPEAIPPFEYVDKVLGERIAHICSEVKATEPPILYLTGEGNFRDKIAKTKGYKANRTSSRPFHFKNLTVFMTDVLGAQIVNGMEADDAMCIEQSKGSETIICTRDKDLRQCPGWAYGWEMGKQPSFGPKLIDKAGYLIHRTDNGKVEGAGLSFFYYQLLIGDTVDNIPGLKGCGPVKAYGLLAGKTSKQQLDIVIEEYRTAFTSSPNPEGILDEWEVRLTEQGRLLWMVRKLDELGEPVMWEIGMEE